MPSRIPFALVAVLGVVVFLANAGLLVLQLLAGRYLAPFIGSSVETWTCVIGVFLSGIALGNAIGGRIADRSPSTRTLALYLLLGGISSLTMLVGMRLCIATDIHLGIPLTPRIPVLTALFCLIPAFVLSLLTPLTIKLMLSDVKSAGSVAGLIFALSTLGCLLGNYATGFWLMAHFTLDAISYGVAGLLILLAILTYLFPYRVPVSPETTTAATDDAFRGKLIRAYAIVFAASFCGMSLELTASRYLAPIVGVSLYSWTGIIGVMLAGTALGNFTGGIVADRGKPLACLSRFVVGNRWFLALVLLCLGYGIGYLIAPAVYPKLASLQAGLEEKDSGIARAIVSVLAYIRSDNVSMIGGIVGAILVTMLLLPSGKEKDRMMEAGVPRTVVLGATLLMAALMAVAALGLTAVFQQTKMFEEYSLVWNIVSWSFGLFFLPMFLLGMVSPQVIRLSVPDAAHVGRVAGSIYAVSTLGAIVGTFATGYFLIAMAGTHIMLLIIAVTLAGLAVCVGRLWRNGVMLFGCAVVLGLTVLGMAILKNGFDRYDLETRYYAIRVSDSTYRGRDVTALALDHLQHSFVDKNDPSFLGYSHEESQGEFLRLAHSKHPETNLLVIGGGGYTFPRWVDYMMPGVQTDVVEIDPGVTQIAYDKLALSSRRIETGMLGGGLASVLADKLKFRRPSRIKSIHMDGRQFVGAVAPKGHYHLIMQDAVNDLSVPYHLMTKEYNEGIKKILAPDGVYLLTLIDSLRDGLLWRAAVHTMRQSFPYVYLINSVPFPEADNPAKLRPGREVMIVYGAEKPLDMDELKAVAAHAKAGGGLTALGGAGAIPPVYTHVMGPKQLDKYLTTLVRLDPHEVEVPVIDKDSGEQVIDEKTRKPLTTKAIRYRKTPYESQPYLLTDQYAPVDNLMSGVFRERTSKRDEEEDSP